MNWRRLRNLPVWTMALGLTAPPISAAAQQEPAQVLITDDGCERLDCFPIEGIC